MEKVILNNIPIAYTRSGQGKPLVLLHGYPLDHRIWLQVAPLLEPDFNLIIPDLRGFGQSGSVEFTYSLADMASDIAELLDYLEIDKAVIVGHSMGGYISLAFARSFPDRLLGLGLVASQALPDTPEGKEARYLAVKQITEQGVGAIAGTMSDKLTSDPNLRDFLYKIIAEQQTSGVSRCSKGNRGTTGPDILVKYYYNPHCRSSWRCRCPNPGGTRNRHKESHSIFVADYLIRCWAYAHDGKT